MPEYCAVCNTIHNLHMNCRTVQRLRANVTYVQELEQQLDGWRNSDTSQLILERDEARAALAEARKELGMRRHPSGVS